jgi:hypothetical protein
LGFSRRERAEAWILPSPPRARSGTSPRHRSAMPERRARRPNGSSPRGGAGGRSPTVLHPVRVCTPALLSPPQPSTVGEITSMAGASGGVEPADRTVRRPWVGPLAFRDRGAAKTSMPPSRSRARPGHLVPRGTWPRTWRGGVPMPQACSIRPDPDEHCYGETAAGLWQYWDRATYWYHRYGVHLVGGFSAFIVANARAVAAERRARAGIAAQWGGVRAWWSWVPSAGPDEDHGGHSGCGGWKPL